MDLVSHRPDAPWVGSHPHKTSLLHSFCKVGRLTQKTIPRVKRITTTFDLFENKINQNKEEEEEGF